jgi:hypothetical protein
VIWQHPSSRRLIKVARLTELRDGYQFEYLPGSKDPNFEPLQSFPAVDRVYWTPKLPAFFQNRVMSRQRASFPQYAKWLGIDPAVDTPFEVLARTGGERATDTFHVAEEPSVGPDGLAVIRFFASGLRHIEDSADRLSRLSDGDPLYVRPEPDNPVNPRALLIDAEANEPIGWVPDWLLDDVHGLRSEARGIELVAERINLSAPAHLKLLCRLAADCR